MTRRSLLASAAALCGAGAVVAKESPALHEYKVEVWLEPAALDQKPLVYFHPAADWDAAWRHVENAWPPTSAWKRQVTMPASEFLSTRAAHLRPS